MPLTTEEILKLIRKHGHTGIDSVILIEYLKLVSNEYSEGQIIQVNSAKKFVLQTILQMFELTAPGADRALFWDHSALAFKFLTMGDNLSITDTTLNAVGGIGNTIAVSNTLQASADTEREFSDGSYTLQKEIQVVWSGGARAKADIKDGTNNSFYKFYKNGVAISAELDGLVNYATKTQDFTVVAGDLLQMFAQGISGGSGFIKNFRVYFTKTAEDVDVTLD